ncbi:YslB family protein [Fructobacillus sp. M2-14]|uniref:YslB family protein n=1 Tax=Fructobacillus broussonetiae TaxID=2713173 RepID=A0ABS5R0B7_9LACO|nr:YslB family protein [Fructobacillus broussonetiae]MBS9338345.1 YslB family protein [Fructobacillus broussonetiae]
MSKAQSQSTIGSNRTENAFASLLLRDGLMKNLLTDDYANITYWAGKDLARQFPQETIENLKDFFLKAAFGDLEISYQGESEQRWVLSGPVVNDRLAINPQADFSLEAGFLAQQVEIQNEAVSEAYFELATRKHEVTITVMIDGEHKITSRSAADQVALRDYFLDQMHGRQVESQVKAAKTEAVTTASADADANAFASYEAPKQTASSSTAATAHPTASTEASQATPAPAPSEPSAHADAAETAPVQDEDDAISVEQSITNSLLAFDYKKKKNSDASSQADR